jgi:hypothetical protein
LRQIHGHAEEKVMLLQRELTVAALAFGIAISLYVISFGDLMAAPSAPIEIVQPQP